MANNSIKPVKLVTEALNKKGKLKGKNKKDKKMLQLICPHHKYTRKGKLHPTIFNNNDGSCICTLCGQTFPAKFYSNKDLGEAVGNIRSINEQAKYMAVATGAGNNTVDYFSNFAVSLGQYKKVYKKVRNVAEKRGNIRNKGKNKNNHSSAGSSQYGSWGRK